MYWLKEWGDLIYLWAYFFVELMQVYLATDWEIVNYLQKDWEWKIIDPYFLVQKSGLYLEV